MDSLKTFLDEMFIAFACWHVTESSDESEFSESDNNEDLEEDTRGVGAQNLFGKSLQQCMHDSRMVDSVAGVPAIVSVLVGALVEKGVALSPPRACANLCVDVLRGFCVFSRARERVVCTRWPARGGDLPHLGGQARARPLQTANGHGQFHDGFRLSSRSRVPAQGLAKRTAAADHPTGMLDREIERGS